MDQREAIAKEWCESESAVIDLEIKLAAAIDRRRKARRELFSNLNNFGGNNLSNRQVQVLDAVRARLANKEIAALLNVSVRTVKFHVSKLLVKFKVANRGEL